MESKKSIELTMEELFKLIDSYDKDEDFFIQVEVEKEREYERKKE